MSVPPFSLLQRLRKFAFPARIGERHTVGNGSDLHTMSYFHQNLAKLVTLR